MAVDVERDRERGQPHDDAEYLPDAMRVRPERGHAGAAAERDEQHRDGRADRVGDGEHDRAEAHVLRRSDDRDRRQHRAGARHEHEPEARAEQQSAPEVAARSPRQAEERSLDDLLDLREEQCRRDEEQERDREVAEKILGQSERPQEPDAEQREGREAEDEPGDDRERLAAAAGRAAREDDRQNREHARRDCRDEPGCEADADQNEHSLVSVESRWLSGNYDASAARAGSGSCSGGVSAVSVLAGLRRLRRFFG